MNDISKDGVIICKHRFGDGVRGYSHRARELPLALLLMLTLGKVYIDFNCTIHTKVYCERCSLQMDPIYTHFPSGNGSGNALARCE